MQRVLITGGAGFIGSHLADLLLRDGSAVRVLDSLVGQVHESAARPAYLDDAVELLAGDVRDPAAVRRALQGCDAVVHLASAVGVGQSMYDITGYVGANDLGTAVLLEALIDKPVGRLIVASSMSIYGEGLSRHPDGHAIEPAERSLAQLKQARWECLDDEGTELAPLATPESKHPVLGSVYALTKFSQERMALIFGRAYDLPTTALRFFNVYGTRQALSNPYTGVIAIFASRLMNGRPPMIFEDGLQRRDFVHVRDVARAIRAALSRPEAAGLAINVGSGVPRTIVEVAQTLAKVLGRPDLQPQVTGRYRTGDIRHCWADPALAEARLGFRASEDFAQGLTELASWLEGQPAVDRVDKATAELERRGLVA